MRLSDPLASHYRLSLPQKAALTRLGLLSVGDLISHLPARYEQGGSATTIAGLSPGMEVSIVGKIDGLKARKAWKSRRPIAEGRLRDASGVIKVMWFNQPYIAKMVSENTTVRATGKVTGTLGKLYLANPAIEKVDDLGDGPLFATEEAKREGADAAQLFAIYPETKGITSLWFRHNIEKAIKSGALDEVLDPIPEAILKKYHLPRLRSALVWAHTPKNLADAQAARKRFAFEEVFYIQIERQRLRAEEAREKSYPVHAPEEDIASFMSTFPFEATSAQKRAVNAICADMRKSHPMSRLLEGDVGSGKTAVAATAAYAAVRTRPNGQTFGTLQVAYMAPTEILAKQHFESFINIFEAHPVPIALMTGSGCYKFPSKVKRGAATPISRSQLLKWVTNGEIPIVIGTHALIEKAVRFKHLALVIIDEQHRFGTAQRRKLARKDVALPHLLSMTATPIPRTLALTIYGDLDLTLLDEMPPGRKSILTEILNTKERERAYERMRKEMAEGRQCYVICPRIDEPDEAKELALIAKSVKEEAKRLKRDVFQDKEIAILHSKMKPSEKDEVMRAFYAHESDILVATSVVEVGVNVPNATVILIEGAERFGLSQLHQLRGRVVRSNHQAYCFALSESAGETTLKRLSALKNAKNGFELAEADLMQRGPGELSGRKQWGISDVGMEALKNLKLVEAARDEAIALVKSDEKLTKYPQLREKVASRAKTLHFE